MPNDLVVVPVTIQNSAELKAEPRYVKKTTVKTYVIDPAASDTTQRWAQIAEYEPSRVRTVIQVIDAACALTLEAPISKPDPAAATVAPQGRYLPNSTAFEYVLFGPDAMWINSMAAVTRVTVTKEYC